MELCNPSNSHEKPVYELLIKRVQETSKQYHPTAASLGWLTELILMVKHYYGRYHTLLTQNLNESSFIWIRILLWGVDLIESEGVMQATMWEEQLVILSYCKANNGTFSLEVTNSCLIGLMAHSKGENLCLVQ